MGSNPTTSGANYKELAVNSARRIKTKGELLVHSRHREEFPVFKNSPKLGCVKEFSMQSYR